MTQNEAESLIRKQILHGTVWNHPDYMESSEGLAMAFREPERAVLMAACISLLTDPDVRIRSGIVSVLGHITRELGSEWLAEILERHPDLYAGVAPEGVNLGQSNLERGILVAIAEGVRPGETRSIGLLRKAAHEWFFGVWMLPALARVDGQWLSEHAGDVVPHKMISVLPPLTPAQREKVVRSLVPWPEEMMAQIPPGFWDQFPPGERKILKELIDGSWLFATEDPPYSGIGSAKEGNHPAPTYVFRMAMAMILGCLTPFFIVFLIWGSRLSENLGYISENNKDGKYEAARRISEEMRPKVNRMLIAAVAAIPLCVGLAVCLHYFG